MITVKLELMKIEDDGSHILVHAYINEIPARLLIDTGASRTVFDEEKIKAFLGKDQANFEKIEKLTTGLGTNTMESHSVVLKEFRLGDSIFNDYQAVVLNMEHVNQSYRALGYPEIDGVVGGDLLSGLGAVIDYRKREIRWRRRA